MTTKDDIAQLVADTVKEQMKRSGLGESYLTPKQLCERWQIKDKALEKWRFEGKPPIYMKVQASKKAIIRYPLYGENGVLDVEQKWLRLSTTDPGGNIATAKNPASL